MKILNLVSAVILCITFTNCSKSTIEKGTPQTSDISGNENSQNTNAGVLTASEWNDLNNWPFWSDLMTKSDYNKFQNQWGFYNANRISVILNNGNFKPLSDVTIDLMKEGQLVFSTKTDNKGTAELWANLFVSNSIVDISKYQISVNKGQKIVNEIKLFSQGINNITMESTLENDNTSNVCFVVDATSSMGDELKYLKNELYDVIDRIKNNNPDSKVYTSAVFYKDEGDDFVTKKSEFSIDGSQTSNFIKAGETSGGGDFPEAVHSALDIAINGLSWSTRAKSRIVFLILDAPPHNTSSVISSLHHSIVTANEKGIKIIPIIASGADKDTEFSMRFMAISTNGTFAFITDDSKKGDKHYQPTVGAYQVEFLNNLMVRLVNANLQ